MVNDTDKPQAKAKRKLTIDDKIGCAASIFLFVIGLLGIDAIAYNDYLHKKIGNFVQNSETAYDYTFHKKLKYNLENDYFTKSQPRFNRVSYKHSFDAIRSAFTDLDGNFLDSRFQETYYSEFESIIKNANYESEKIFKSASEEIDKIAQNKLIECNKKLEELASHPDIAQLNALKKRYYETFNPLWMFRK